MRKLGLVIVLILFQSNSYKSTLKKTVCFQCKSIYRVHLSLPNHNFVPSTHEYEEGHFVTFQFKDLSRIVVHCGAMQKIPILGNENYKEQDITIVEKKRIRRGVKERLNKHWREDNYFNGISIYFDNVHDSALTKYNLILDSLVIVTVDGS